MKVLSLNLWNINSRVEERMRILDDHIASAGYDLLVFQEVSPFGPASKPQTDMLKSLDKFHTAYQETGSWLGRPEGLAILARDRPTRVECRRLPRRDSDMDRGLLHLQFDTGRRRLHVLNTHFAFKVEDEDLRLHQATVVRNVIESVVRDNPRDHVLFCGDLNDTPGSATVDLFSGLAGLTSPFSGGLATMFTFSSQNPYVVESLVPDRRIDHVYTTKHTKVAGCEMVLCSPGEFASDHFGLALTMKL